jgi:hypothetical protein
MEGEINDEAVEEVVASCVAAPCISTGTPLYVTFCISVALSSVEYCSSLA